MQVVGVSLRDFRGYAEERAALGDGLTVISGPNGAGKTNLLEGLYFGCTGRSCRTNNERELVRFGAPAARVVVTARGEDGPHELSVGFVPGQPKRMRVDGAPVQARDGQARSGRSRAAGVGDSARDAPVHGLGRGRRGRP